MVKEIHTVGVLALQGNFTDHIAQLHHMNVEAKEVRTPEDLDTVDALIIPGGESTTMSTLLTEKLRTEILQRHRKGSFPILGTCAGAILLAKRITGLNPPATLGLLDITIERNAYGSQHQSFRGTVNLANDNTSLQATFIRAPRITESGGDVEVLATLDNSPVLVCQGNVFASTFHPELDEEEHILSLFLDAMNSVMNN